ncbi:ABC transporter ATP-binding protein [Verrucomicrobiota bacterium]
MSFSIQNLSMAFAEKEVLKNVTLNIQRGEFLSILGPNGAGKSTLLKCICGILHDWRGKIELEGKPLTKYSPRARAQLVSYVPQSVTHRLPFTVFAFVAMGRYPHLSPFSTLSTADRTHIDEAIAAVGMQDFRERQMDTLSGGERQMVMIAAALAQGGNILVLDEPITFLDYRHQVAVMKTLQRLNQEKGFTIITVNHDLHSALQFSTKLAALKNGELIRHDAPSTFREEAFLQELYGTQFRKLEFDEHELILPEGLLP